MKTHTNKFKNNIKTMGRLLDSKVTYELNGETIELSKQQLNSITPSFDGDILKSVMKSLVIDSNVDIALNTVLNYQFGVKVDDEYEYLDFGDYIVYKSEKQEDTRSYLITCYDKMLYSMKDYESMGITYPITIRNYINTICNHLGITFKNINDTFANYNKQIKAELYLDAQGKSIGYTFRDVLDELAEVTASTICIDDENQLEIRYINDTGDTIDESFLKDVNVNFGEKYGPVNTIVLSRSGGSDKIYKSYPENLPENERFAIEIADNQIMNFNDRDEYLPDLLFRLNGLEYYLNDFSSTGITYYDLCDRYNVTVFGKTYSCVMLNDEINITQGLQENVHTDMPKETVTDYTKADKTDRKINQTYLIVDKQNQTIESVVSQVDTQNTKISQITQTVDELNSKISDIADITISGESNFATFTLDNINESEPIQIKVKPISESISYLYPNNDIYPTNSYFPATEGLVPSNSLTPSNSLKPQTKRNAQDIIYLKDRKIRFHNNTTNEDIDYILPDNLLIYDTETYDEFYLDYDSQTCQVTKRCKYNVDGTISKLATEQIINYPYPSIILNDGDYTLSLLGYEYGYLFVRLMAKNIYTSQFYTKAETDSHINQKANEIELGVNQTLNNYSTTSQMNAAISLSATNITSTVAETYETKTNAQTQYSQIQQTTDSISQTVATKVGDNEIISKINQTPEQIQINANKVSLNGKTINLTSDNIAINSTNFNVDKGGNMTCNNANVKGTVNSNNGSIGGWNITSDGLSNGDGTFIENDGYSNIYNVVDLYILTAMLRGDVPWIPMPQPGTPEFERYDLNNDGVIDSRDLLIMRRKTLGQ